MTAVQNRKRVVGLSTLCLLILVTVFMLRFDAFLSLNVWIIISISPLLIVGFVGCMLKQRALSIFGIVGSILFLLSVIITCVQWPEDYGFIGLEFPGNDHVLVRLVLLLSVAVSLLVCFILVTKWNKSKVPGSN